MAYLTQAYRGGDDAQRSGWWLHFDYDEDVVAHLKERIPSENRTWDDDRKRWWVSHIHEDVLSALFGNFDSFKLQARMFD